MDISQHIKVLLSEHDCVIVPNFGAFIADYSPAVVSDDKSTIPGKDILFNRQLTRNDGLLINALIEEQGLEYAEAKKALEAYVADVNKQLTSGKSVDFDGIGTLSHDEAGFVHFVGDENNTCLLSSYGLQPVTLSKVKREETSSAQKSLSVDAKRTRRIVMRVASVAAVAILLLIFAPPVTDKSVTDYASLGFDESTPKVVHNSTPVSELKDAIPSKAVSVELPSLPANDVVETTLPLSRKTPAKVVVPTNSKQYHIIIASLASERLAQDYVDNFKRKYDFDTVEKISGNGRYRISVAYFSQRKEAIAFVQSLRLLNPKFNDAWVLPQTVN